MSILENKLISSETPPIQTPNSYENLENKSQKHIDLSAILMEIKLLASLHNPVFEIGNLENLITIDSICEYQIEFSSFNVGKFQFINKYSHRLASVLGLLFENTVENLSEKLDEFLFSQIPGLNDIEGNKNLLRNQIMSKESIGKKHLFSVLEFCSKTKRANFWMSNHDFNAMKSKWKISIIRTDSWDRLTQQEELSSAKEILAFSHQK